MLAKCCMQVAELIRHKVDAFKEVPALTHAVLTPVSCTETQSESTMHPALFTRCSSTVFLVERSVVCCAAADARAAGDPQQRSAIRSVKGLHPQTREGHVRRGQLATANIWHGGTDWVVMRFVLCNNRSSPSKDSILRRVKGMFGEGS